MAVPTAALFFTSLMFVSKDAPPVSSLILLSRYGVISLPVSRFPSASLSACSTAASTRAPCAVASSGIGTPVWSHANFTNLPGQQHRASANTNAFLMTGKSAQFEGKHRLVPRRCCAAPWHWSRGLAWTVQQRVQSKVEGSWPDL